MRTTLGIVILCAASAAFAEDSKWTAQQPYRAVFDLKPATASDDSAKPTTKSNQQRVVRVSLDVAAWIGSLGGSESFVGESLRVEALDGAGRSTGCLPNRWDHRRSPTDGKYTSAGELTFVVPDPATAEVAVYFGPMADSSRLTASEPPIGDGDFLRQVDSQSIAGSTTLPLPGGYPSIVDVDRDSRRDLIASDRYGSGAVVCWFRNIGSDASPAFSEREVFRLETTDGKPISNPNQGWLLTPVFTDWDADGRRDLLIGGWCRYLNFHKNVGTDEQPVFAPGKVIFDAKMLPGLDYGRDPETRFQGVFIEVCDWDGDEKLDLLCGTYTRGHIYLLRNTGETSDTLPVLAEPVALEAGGKPIDLFVHCKPSVGDWDGDGDLDMMTGQYYTDFAAGPGDMAGCYYFENIGDRRHPKLADRVPLESQDGRRISAGFHSEPTMVDWNLDGKMDVLVTGNGPACLFQNAGTAAQRKLVQTKVPWDAPEVCRGHGFAYPIAYDLDRDGALDLIVADGDGNVLFFKGLPKLQFAAPIKIKSVGQEIHEVGCPDGGEKLCGYVKVAIADPNGDGWPDMIMWTNNGLAGWQPGSLGPDGWCLKFFPGTSDPLNFGPSSEIQAAGQHIGAGYRSKPDVIDLDGDGLLDLAVVCGNGQVNGPCTIMMCKNVGSKTRWELAATVPLTDTEGKPLAARVRTALRFVDWDGDGDLDLYTGNPGGLNVRYYRNVGTSARPVFDSPKPMDLVNKVTLSHHECGVDVVDLDRDGTLDLLVGNGDSGAVHFFRRGFLEAGWRLALTSLESKAGARIPAASLPGGRNP